jgi:hypothetical protein
MTTTVQPCPSTQSMVQPPLPFRQFRPVSDLCALWFYYANSADYGDDKRYWFYPFKSRFLKQHAIPDGIDLQVITRHCHTCYQGIWHSESGRYNDICWNCNGTGIFRVDRVLLSRWILNGTVYHNPIRRLEPGEEYEGFRNTLDGLVRHEKIPAHLGRRCLSLLLLRYEPKEWLRWQRWKFQAWRRGHYWQFGPVRRFLADMIRDWRHSSGTNYDDEIPF